MERRIYRPTEKQEQRWAAMTQATPPSDDEFKERWMKAHHGKLNGWGMGKRDWIVSNLRNCREYQMGLWQGMVDRARGLDYSEERNENTYNLGYHRGYNDYEGNRRGWDAQTRARFEETYLID